MSRSTQRTGQLIGAREHQLIVAYNQEYDDAIHATHPQSPGALAGLEHHVGSFGRLADIAAAAWAPPYVVLLATDHGTHVDQRPDAGRTAATAQTTSR